MRTPPIRPAMALGTIAVAVAWLLALVPTGLDLHDLASFSALGAILWLAFGAAVHVASRRDWPWRSTLRSALLGATVLPPILALLVAVAGVDRPQQLLMLFIFGAWLTIGAGAITGAFTRVAGPRRRGLVRRTAAAVRERMLRRRAVRLAPLSRAPADTPALRPR